MSLIIECSKEVQDKIDEWNHELGLYSGNLITRLEKYIKKGEIDKKGSDEIFKTDPTRRKIQEQFDKVSALSIPKRIYFDNSAR